MEKYLSNLALVENPHEHNRDNNIKLGVISHIDQLTGAVLVSFGDLTLSGHEAGEVKLLKDRNTLYRELLSSARVMEMQTFKVLLRVSMLQDRGSSASLLEAMQLLRKNPDAMKYATVSLSVLMGFSQLREREKPERNGR
ncbi:hypothetical protein [Pedobacter miscanthi]|uniref:hypothetical protein n=1 Tax=Pedobacter miscanthi TaxID=2259170 RepID=UPI002931D74B|nr:hypothetical protein [Pedobacter miscanthi]